MGNDSSKSKTHTNKVGGKVYPQTGSSTVAVSSRDSSPVRPQQVQQVQQQAQVQLQEQKRQSQWQSQETWHEWKVGDPVSFQFNNDGVRYLGHVIAVEGEYVIVRPDVGPGRDASDYRIRGNAQYLERPRFSTTMSIARVHRDEDRKKELRALGIACYCDPTMECWCKLKYAIPEGYNNVLADGSRRAIRESEAKLYSDSHYSMYSRADEEVKRDEVLDVLNTGKTATLESFAKAVEAVAPPTAIEPSSVTFHIDKSADTSTDLLDDTHSGAPGGAPTESDTSTESDEVVTPIYPTVAY